jgi:competence ComEA-like helix-hairpin-helix protein
MFNLTFEERKVILFLVSVAFLGLGVSFAVKVNSRVKKFIHAEAGISRIDINKADLRELLATRAIPLKLAKNIIAYRDEKGAFRDIRELKEIKGIGDYRYGKLKELFFIE